jgi:hypothetical protein
MSLASHLNSTNCPQIVPTFPGPIPTSFCTKSTAEHKQRHRWHFKKTSSPLPYLKATAQLTTPLKSTRNLLYYSNPFVLWSQSLLIFQPSQAQRQVSALSHSLLPPKQPRYVFRVRAMRGRVWSQECSC